MEKVDHRVPVEVAVLPEDSVSSQERDLPALAIRIDQPVRIAGVIGIHRRHLERDIGGRVEHGLHLRVGLERLALDDAEAGRHAAHRHVFGRDRLVADELGQRLEITDVAPEIVVMAGVAEALGNFIAGRIVFLRQRVDARLLHQLDARVGLAVHQERAQEDEHAVGRRLHRVIAVRRLTGVAGRQAADICRPCPGPARPDRYR